MSSIYLLVSDYFCALLRKTGRSCGLVTSGAALSTCSANLSTLPCQLRPCQFTSNHIQKELKITCRHAGRSSPRNLQSLPQRMTSVNRRRIDGALWLQEQMMTCRTLAIISLLILPCPHSTAGIPRCREYMTQIEHDSWGIVHGYRRDSYVPRIHDIDGPPLRVGLSSLGVCLKAIGVSV